MHECVGVGTLYMHSVYVYIHILCSLVPSSPAQLSNAEKWGEPGIISLVIMM